MIKKFTVALALVALMAAPAFASVQNVKVGGALKTTSVIRDSFDLGSRAATQSAQNVFLSQTALDVSADLTDNVSTKIGLVNERLWGTDQAGTSKTGAVLVDTAYVTMKELLYSPLTVTVGRQPLQYGNQLIIGDGDFTTDVATVNDITGGINFDAIKAVLSYDPLTVDLFAAKVNENGDLAQNDNNDTDLFGINANYKLGSSMNTVIEAYTFAKIDKAAVSATNPKQNKIFVPGLRVSTNPIEGLNVQLEGAYQFGQTNTAAATESTDVSAYAVQAMTSYALPVLKDMKPVLSGAYSYFSGDKTKSGTVNEGWDVMYKNQYVGRIYHAIFPHSNLQVLTIAGELTPIQDLTTKLSLSSLWTARKLTPGAQFTQADGTSINPVMNSKTGLGNEVDLDVTYAYTEDVKLGLSAGYFAPGKAFSSANKDSASQILSSVAVAF